MEVVAAVVKWAVAKWAAMSTAAKIWFAIKAIAVVGSVMYSQAQARKAARMARGLMNGARTLTVKEPTACRTIVYGECRVGGTLIYVGSSGTNKEYLHYLVAHAGHECEAIGDCYLNDELVPLDGSGNATGKYAGYVTILKHLGSTSQTHDTALTTAMGAEWTSAHDLRGICYSYIRLKHNVDLFPSGMPSFSATIQGKKLYDTRIATTYWHWNAALCLRDYLTDTSLGLGASSAEIDDTLLQAAANVCDEAVTLLAGGTEDRYMVNGVIDTSQTPGAVIEDICAAMAGSCPWVGGKFRIKAGAHTSSVQTLTLDDARGSITVSAGDALRDSFNGVKGVFMAEANQWQPADFPPYVKLVTAGSFVVGQRYCIVSVGTTTFTSIGAGSNAVGVVFTATGVGSGTGTADPYQGEDIGARVWRDISLPFTTSAACAQRLAKIELMRNRNDTTVRFPAKLTALNLQAGDVCSLTIARYGWTAKLFEVVESAFVVEQDAEGNPTLGINLLLRSTASTDWSWSTADEQSIAAAPESTLPDPFTVPTPSGLTLTAASLIQTDGTVVPRILIEWTAPADATVTSGGRTHIEYKRTADSEWTVWSVPSGELVSDYLTDIEALIGYDVRIWHENVRGVSSDYSSTVALTVNIGSVGLPSLDPPGQLFTTTVTILASCSTTGATIRYTTDGTPVRSDSTAFPGGGLTLTSSALLRVRAFNGDEMSNEVQQQYTLNAVTAKVATPSISFSPTPYSSGSATSTCTITCATTGLSNHYERVNGGGWTAYSGAFSVNSGDRVESYATKAAHTDSDAAYDEYWDNT